LDFGQSLEGLSRATASGAIYWWWCHRVFIERIFVRRTRNVRQPISGIAGSKPRVGQHDGNGKISRAESHALDREYRVQRNLTLRLKNCREELTLRRLDDAWVEWSVIEHQIEVILAAMKFRITSIHRSWLGRLEACGSDQQKLITTLQDLESDLLESLSKVPEDLQRNNGRAETPSGTVVPEAPSETTVSDEKLTPTFSKAERARKAAAARWEKAREKEKAA
jgi:hypothetical protein